MTEHSEVALVGGGCFWCLDAAFGALEGVAARVCGFAGGRDANPTYEAVCQGDTGHAEVVQVTFDPQILSYERFLRLFFALHDPTTLNRQGHDIGTQYRSVIFTYSDAQQATAHKLIVALNARGLWRAPIVTQLHSAPAFYPAEGFHQNYYAKNPENAYCQAVIAPKLAQFKDVLNSSAS